MAEQQLTFEQMKAELETAKDQIHVLKSRKRYKLDMENRIEQLMVPLTGILYNR